MYLENCSLVGNQRNYTRDIVFSKSELRLSNTVFLQNIVLQIHDLLIPDVIQMKFTSIIYTYQCLMTHGNQTLKTNVTEFKHTAIEEHFIQNLTRIHSQINLVIEETPFAASELSVSIFVQLKNTT